MNTFVFRVLYYSSVSKMPYARKTRPRPKRKPTRKPTYSRRRKAAPSRRGGTMALRNPRPTVQRGYQPFGLTMYTRQMYTQHITLTAPGVGTTVSNAFRLNSMFDPDLTGVGHQPMQFDQVAVLYNSYIVTGALVDVTFTNPDADGMWVGIRLRNGANGMTSAGRDLATIQELRDVQSRPLNNTGKQSVRLRIFVPNHILLGISRATYMAELETYGALVTADPLATTLLDVWAASTTGGALYCQAIVKIRYHCKYFNPISIGSS